MNEATLSPYGKLLSVNVGRPRPVAYQDRLVSTGIFKQPVEGPLMLQRTNLAGDGQADLAVHGGEDKAVYVYAHEMYAYWQNELGRDDFAPGQFGENFTVEGLTDEVVCIGDVYRVGQALVQVTQPRAPCFKLGIRMNDATFPKQFLQNGRVGFYLRVLAEGLVAAGDEITCEWRDPHGISVEQVCRLLYFDRQNAAAIRRVLNIAGLSDAWRESFEKLLSGERGP